jgi:hypothetical protein
MLELTRKPTQVTDVRNGRSASGMAGVGISVGHGRLICGIYAVGS